MGVFAYIGDETWLLAGKEVSQATKHGNGVIDVQVSSLAEEIGLQHLTRKTENTSHHRCLIQYRH